MMVSYFVSIIIFKIFLTKKYVSSTFSTVVFMGAGQLAAASTDRLFPFEGCLKSKKEGPRERMCG